MAETNTEEARALVFEEPYYKPFADEVEVFLTAYQKRLPVLLKGPTGCGKTRFMEFMAWRLKRPLITVSCHDDLTSADLVGRYLIRGGETVWVDGPLTRAVRTGALCYLDEIVEARKDTTVVIHPLTDHRRILPIEKLGETLCAPNEFMLTLSYNPGYQSIVKDLKPSTRQRFVSLEFDYPDKESEAEIISRESEVDADTARQLVRLGRMTRNLKEKGLNEGGSTRLLIYAGQLMNGGLAPERACQTAIAQTLTDDGEIQRAIGEMVKSIF
jgi:nitric oxide reductase NorQ protein